MKPQDKEQRKEYCKTCANKIFVGMCESCSFNDKEQTLSDKIGWAHECFEEYLHQEDVKEFIKKLKEEARQIHQGKPFYYSSEKKMQFILDKIDKLAGDKLI